jgi:ribosome-associated heat shock protein Hsp15
VRIADVESVRIDKWLVAVRVYKNRSDAADACGGGKVRVGGRTVKPASPVKVGDRVRARVGERVRELEVVRLIEQRVGAAVAAECFVDHSPPVERRARKPRVPVFEREAGAGRPTKRDRRELRRLRGR